MQDPFCGSGGKSERHKAIDFNQFYADMALQPVATFFSKGLAQGTKEIRDKYAKINHYKDADSILFGPKPETTVPAEDEASVWAEFGSRFEVPTPSAE